MLGRILDQRQMIKALINKKDDETYANTVKTANERIKVLRKVKNPIELKINEGHVLMKLRSQKEYLKLELEINTNGNLKENFTIRKEENEMSKIIIYNAEEYLENDEITNCLKSQNKNLVDSNVKVKFKMKAKVEYNISLEPEDFH